MPVVLAPIPDHELDAPVPPVTEAGEPFPLSVLLPDGSAWAFGHTVTDLVEAVLSDVAPEYGQSSEQDRLVARITYMLGIQPWIQAAFLEAYADVITGLTETQLETLLRVGVEQPNVDMWTGEVPLVLVRSGYAPYSEIPVPLTPEGDVENPSTLVWLRPETEEGFLGSLEEIDFIRVAKWRPESNPDFDDSDWYDMDQP